MEKLEIIEKEIEENFEKSRVILKNYFKTLYDNAGMDWTEENNNDIDFVMKSILMKSVYDAGKLIIKTHLPQK